MQQTPLAIIAAVHARLFDVDNALQTAPGDPDLSRTQRELEAALLRAADELHADACISDATWGVLAAQLDERQLIEVPMLIGHYHLVAFTLNSLGVQREPGVPGFGG